MRLAETAGSLADGLYYLDPETGQGVEETSVSEIVPEPPGKDIGGFRPPTSAAGAGR
jgi:hypothetical protein